MLKIEDVGKCFTDGEKEKWVVNHVNFNVSKGQFISIVGRSGSGKSTLLKMIGGLLKPSAGRIEYEGIDIYSLGDKELADYRCNKIGFVFQDFFLEDNYSVYQNVEVVLMIAGVPLADRRKMVEDALACVDMLDKKDDMAGILSGGEKQRVSIARAIVNNPCVICADEPCGNLDYENGEIVMNLLRKQAQMGKMVILITHNNDDANRTDGKIRLQDGEIVKNELE